MQFWETRVGYRESGLLTPQLRETFYYARARQPVSSARRDVEPIQYQR
ncbi:MAG: hypothetical protein ACUVRJ_09565 [Candidatus Villigracilaceae bacterium]